MTWVVSLFLRGARASALTACALLGSAIDGSTAEVPLLQLEAKIPLGEVSGRIDHMAADVKRQRLFVAELGNNTLGVVDLAAGKLLRTLTGLKEPQGVGYESSGDIIYVANARDGSVHLFQGLDFASAGTIELGKEADNPCRHRRRPRDRWPRPRRSGGDRCGDPSQNRRDPVEGASRGIPARLKSAAHLCQSA